jgi:hypothetical protein
MYKHKKEIWEKLYRIADNAYEKNMKPDDIKALLIKEHGDPEMAYAVVKKVISDRYTERRKEGLAIVLLGALLIVIGFFLTCFNFHTNKSITFALYGLTSAGILVAFWGFYKIMG